MTRFISIALETCGVQRNARLFDHETPRTAAAVWDALPLSGRVSQAKYERNEIYALLPVFAPRAPDSENTTITSISDDRCWFSFSNDQLANLGYGYTDGQSAAHEKATVDLMLFYSRNNLLINGDEEWGPGNVFATVVSGPDEMATAALDLWTVGPRGETLTFARAEQS